MLLIGDPGRWQVSRVLRFVRAVPPVFTAMNHQRVEVSDDDVQISLRQYHSEVFADVLEGIDGSIGLLLGLHKSRELQTH